MGAFGGLLRAVPLLGWGFIVAAFASLGLPGLAHFPAEFQIFLGVFRAHYYWAGGLGILAAAITATYILRMLARAYFGPLNERWEDLREMRIGEQAAAMLLISAIVVMGVWPALFLDRIADSVKAIPGLG